MKIGMIVPLVLCACTSAQTATARPLSAMSKLDKSVRDATPVNNRQAPEPNYVIGATDILAVSVWREPDISRTVSVRSDGKISLALAGEIQASGMTPSQLEREVTARLQNYISDPEVTVIVQESRSQRFNILGQVVKPGAYPLADTTTVLDAIAMAGGFRDFAKQKSIYVLRTLPDGSRQKLPFNYRQVIKGFEPDQNVRLEPHDTVVVP